MSNLSTLFDRYKALVVFDMHAALDYAAKIKHAQKDFLTSQGIHAIID